MNPPDYAFPRLTRGDLPLLRRWLGEPHLSGWWGDAAREIPMIEADLASGDSDMRLVTLHGTPFAFVQDYPAHRWPAPQYAALPETARAMDTFLGDPAFIGQGYAARYLRLRADALIAAGAPAVAVDPSPDNARAIAAYAGAGFADAGLTSDGEGAPVRVMIRHAPGGGPPVAP